MFCDKGWQLLFKQCLVVNPASPAANFEVAYILELNKRPDSSLFYINRAVNEDPGNTWYKYFYAQNLQELGKVKEVVKEVRGRDERRTDEMRACREEVDAIRDMLPRASLLLGGRQIRI